MSIGPDRHAEVVVASPAAQRAVANWGDLRVMGSVRNGVLRRRIPKWLETSPSYKNFHAKRPESRERNAKRLHGNSPH